MSPRGNILLSITSQKAQIIPCICGETILSLSMLYFPMCFLTEYIYTTKLEVYKLQ